MRAEGKVAGLLLTGGASLRMGRPKATLRINGQTLAQRAAAALEEVCELALEVGPGYTSLPAVREDPPLSGPLAAVAAGAEELDRRHYEGGAIVLAVDMPFVTSSLLSALASFGTDRTSAIPVADGEPQTLCARYSRDALGAARRLAANGAKSMKALLDGNIEVSWMGPDEWARWAGEEAFVDLDDENDLRLMQELAAQALAASGPRRGVHRTEVLTFDGFRVERRSDSLAAEEPMEIRAAGPGQEPVSVSITMRTPGHDFDLAAGFLFTEGLAGPADISSIKYCEIPREEQQYNIVTVKLSRPFHLAESRRNFYTTSSCGICGKASLDQLRVQCDPLPAGPMFGRSVVQAMPGELSRRQRIFQKTGGLHAAGLFDHSGKLLTLREDVGRHNACDKLIGRALLSGTLPLADHALFVSGRLSFEIVQKAAAAGLPLIAAVSAPSSLAVEAARSLGITLAGFVRNTRFNLYAHPERLDPDG